MRQDGRSPNELRAWSIEPGFIPSALGSALVTAGRTRVICTANLEERPPAWLQGGGWVTAQYAMLPGATSPRGSRDPGGRGKEIQRLIGRGLRAAVDRTRLVGPKGPVSIICDCDVIEADGGTRTAAITGAFVALSLATQALRAQGVVVADPIVAAVAAVSVGLVTKAGADSVPLLDLCYSEDASAEVDMNVVAQPGGALIKVQGTGEQGSFTRRQLDGLLDVAEVGLQQLFSLQRQVLERS